RFQGPINDTEDFVINSNIPDRLGGLNTWVLNAGGSAVSVVESTVYGDPEIPASRLPQYEVHYGNVFEVYRKIDYVFTDFPKKISTKSSSELRRRLGLVPGGPLVAYEALIADKRIDEAVRLKEWAERSRAPGYEQLKGQDSPVPADQK